MKETIHGFVPRCPNHGEPLELDNIQMTQTKGSSPCPVSKVLFEWEQVPEQTGYIKDKDGNLIQTKTFVVDGDD